MGASAWTEAEVTALRELYDAGLSATQIAGRINGFSRNAVIGKLNRLGLKRRGENPILMISNGVVHRRPRRAKGKAISRRRSRSKPIAPTIIVMPDGADIPLGQRKQVGELTNETCRWGFNDPCARDFFFCGAPEADLAKHRPYCAFHMLRAIDQSQLPF